jgi:hypothetical protein
MAATASPSPEVFVLTDWDAENKYITSSMSFIVDDDSPSPSRRKKQVHILYGVQEWKRSNWEAAQIDSIIAGYIDTKQLILVFDGDNPWSGRIEVFDRLGQLKFNQIIDKVIHIEILRNWLNIGEKMIHEKAKHSPSEQELKIIREQIIALEEGKVDLPRCVSCMPGRMEHLLVNHYKCSDEEKDQIILNMYSSRRTPSKTEEIGELIEKKTLTKEEIIEKYLKT